MTAMAVSLRLATLEDAKIIFDWRNDPWIVSLSSSQKTVTWQDHVAWLSKVLKDHNYQIYLIEHEGMDIGSVRFERKTMDSCDISVYLVREQTGRGLGVEAIRQGCQEIIVDWNVKQIWAKIRDNNRHSKSAFQKAGFVAVTKKSNFIEEWVLSIDTIAVTSTKKKYKQ
ncbi:GNAT family N-acetyltransferase [Moorena producens]|uniref:GNAT family N-acetyltransferase n=1 Tax=Moorena producens TaxID=1155739 RepID=UPI003C73A602